jgi:hypothetical protein
MRDWDVRFTQEPVDMGGVTTAVFDDTCGNLIQIALFICEGRLENGPDGRHVAADPYQFRGVPRHQATYVLEEAGVRDFVEFYPEE